MYCRECLACRGGHATVCERRIAEAAGTWIGVDALRDPRSGELYHGAMAEYCVVPAYCGYHVPNSIRDEQLAAIEGVAFSVRCIRSSGLRLGDDVVMFVPQLLG